MGYIYLASPYSHSDPEVRTKRFLAAEAFVANRLREGTTIYSPVVFCHEIACRYHLPPDIDFWWQHNVPMLEVARELWILTLDGWQDSRGIARERSFASRRMIPIVQVPPLLGVDL